MKSKNVEQIIKFQNKRWYFNVLNQKNKNKKF